MQCSEEVKIQPLLYIHLSYYQKKSDLICRMTVVLSYHVDISMGAMTRIKIKSIF